MQETLKTYNNQIVQEHPLYADWHSTLNEVSERDYQGEYPFNCDICCLDMDEYAHRGFPGIEPPSTVDAVIGCSEVIKNCQCNPGLLLVELRMGYQRVHNVSMGDLVEKVTSTKRLLGAEKTIRREVYFVFKEDMLASVKNYFERKKREQRMVESFIPCSVAGFHQIIKSVDDIPYQPFVSSDEILSSFQHCLETKGEDELFQVFEYWDDKIEYYRVRYNPYEVHHIKEELKRLWPAIKQRLLIPDSEDLSLAVELIEEDHNYLGKE